MEGSDKGGWGRRWIRRTGVALVAIFVLIGVWSGYRFFTGPPGVGHFRSAAGYEEYAGHYRDAMAALPEPSEIYDISTDHGVVRAYEWFTPETEDDVPVVLFPGRASGTPMWAENLPGFADGRRVIAFDLLGDAGMSVQGAPLTTFDEQAVWIDEVLGELAPVGAHVVGHSFGGAVAAAYAQAYPEHVRSLTLLEPVFTIAYPPPSMMFWAMVGSLPVLPQGARDTALERIGGVEEGEGQDDPMVHMIAAGTEHYSAALLQPSPLSDEQVSRLTMPVYVALAGDDSLAGGDDREEKARELIPGADVQVWSGTTHSLPMQEPEALNEVLQEFWGN